MNWRRWTFASSPGRWIATGLFILVIAVLAVSGMLP